MGDSEENISNFLNAPLKSAIYTRAVELALKQTAIWEVIQMAYTCSPCPK